MRVSLARDLTGADSWVTCDLFEQRVYESSTPDLGLSLRGELELDDACALEKIELDRSPPETSVRLWKTCATMFPEERRWWLTTSRPVRERWALGLAGHAARAAHELTLGYRERVVQVARAGETSLSRACIDRPMWESCMKNERTSALESLEPDAQGFALPVRYDFVSTRVRASATAGPQLARLNARDRCCLKSRWIDGKIMQLDFSAFEPSVARALVGRRADIDPYLELATTIGCERDLAKNAFLSAMFGMGITTLSGKLGTELEKTKVLADAVHRETQREMLLDRLRPTVTDGIVRSVLGRPVPLKEDYSDRDLYAAYVKATASDVALVCLSRAAQALVAASVRACPIFFLHDALVFDCADLKTASEILSKEAVKCPELDATFRAAIKEFS